MAKILFTPFSVVGGLIAGLVARRLFDRAWEAVDHTGEPPEPGHEDATVPKVLAAAVLQAAVFAAVRALFDRGARTAFSRLFGTWPGTRRDDAG